MPVSDFPPLSAELRWRPRQRNRLLGLTLLLSAAFHIGLLTLHIAKPLIERLKASPLEIVLVNARHTERPPNPDALAQASLKGGGNTTQSQLLTSPLPYSVKDRTGNSLQQLRRKRRALEKEHAQLMHQLKKTTVVLPSHPKPQTTTNAERSDLQGIDLYNSSLALLKREALIAKQINDYQKKPRSTFLTARTAEAIGAAYYAQWVSKVERWGELNYPRVAEGIQAKLRLTVTVRPDGTLNTVELNQSSGRRAIDDAAIAIVRAAAPYAKPTADLLGPNEQLVITSTFNFTQQRKINMESH